MRRLISIVSALTLMAAASPGQAVPLVVDLVDVTNGGGFFGRVTFEDTGVNQVTITADVSAPINPGITRGDILGLWFDFATIAQPAVSSLTLVSGNIIPGSLYSTDSVPNSLGGNVNLSGSGLAGWDLGLVVGQNGVAGGFNQTVSLVLAATGLNTSEFVGQRVGMRVQSIQGVADFGDSSKMLVAEVDVPAPAALGLLLVGLGLMGGASRRRGAASH